MNSVGRYEIIEQLGQGGMGTVYKAFDPLLTRVVAVKVISAQLDTYPEHRDRFFREARAAAQLSHRNIITIYDLGEQDGAPFLAMEYLEGRDLEQRLREPEPMTLARKLELAMSVCEGLAYAHQCGVVHRDIKPANVFVTGDGVVKILDFGLARFVTSELTRSGLMVGTVNYMAPEQLKGEKSDHRADIFSFGVLLYELLGGRKPFQGDSVASTMYKIIHDTPAALEQLDPNLGPPLTTVVDRAIAKAREDRYQRMTDLLRDLEAAYEPLRGADRRVIDHISAALRPATDARGRPGSASRLQDLTPTMPFDRPPVLVATPPPVAGTPRPATPPPVPGPLPATTPAPGERAPRTRRLWQIGGGVVCGLAVVLWLLFGREPPPAPAAGSASVAAPAGTPGTSPAPAQAPASPSVQAPASAAPQPVEPPAPPPSPAQASPPAPRDGAGDLAARVARALRDAREAFDAARYTEASRLVAQAQALEPGNRDARALATRIAAIERGRATSALTAMDAAKASAVAALARDLVPPLMAAAEREEALARRDLDAQRFTAASARLEATATLYRSAETAARSESESRATRARVAEESRRRVEQAEARAVPPPPAPAPPPAATPARPPEPAPPTPPATDAVAAALRRYAAALEQRDLQALLAVWPGVSRAQRDAIEREFVNARSISVELASPRIEITGATASATVVRHYRIESRDGQQLRSDTLTTITLRQGGSGWIIESMRHRPAP